MKKVLLIGSLLVISTQVMADTPQNLLKKVRENYYKEQEAIIMEKKAAEKKAKMEAEEKAKQEKLAKEQEAKAMKLKQEEQARQEKMIKEQEAKAIRIKKEEEKKKIASQKKAQEVTKKNNKSEVNPRLETMKEETTSVAREKVIPKTQLERLEELSAESAVKVDFYERVVRSVAREEIELKKENEEANKKSKYDKIPKVKGLGK